MRLSKEIPDAVQWSEGMLLSPQHFQQQTLRLEQQLSHLRAQLNPYFWGILSLEVDPDKLVGGVFQIHSLRAVMPDGLNVFYNKDNDCELSMDFKDLMKVQGDEVSIYLGVPIQKSQSANPYAEVTRYDSIDDVEVEDENSSDIRTTLQRLKPRLVLLAKEDSKFVTICLAKLTQEKAGFKKTNYLPPQLLVGSDSDLGKEIVDILVEVRKIAELLASTINPGTNNPGDPLVLQHQFMVQHLVMPLPSLEILIQSGSAHPLNIYLDLARMVGALVGLKQGMVPSPLPNYSHDDFRPCLDKVKKIISETLLMGQLSYSSVAFKKIKDGHFILPKEEFLNRKTLLVSVVGHPESSSKSQIEWISECIIGSKFKIEALSKQRAVGAQRAHVKDPSQFGIFPGSGESFFKIVLNSENFKEGEDLVVINSMGSQSLSPHPESMVFYVVQSEEGNKDAGISNP